MKLLILCIDSPFGHFGGLGVSINESVRWMAKLDPTLDIWSFGSGKEGKIDNFQHTHLFGTGAEDIIKNPKSFARTVLQSLHDANWSPNLLQIMDWRLVGVGSIIRTSYNIPQIYTIALSDMALAQDLCPSLSARYPEATRRMLERNSERLKLIWTLEQQALRESARVVFVSQYYHDLFRSRLRVGQGKTILNGGGTSGPVHTTKFSLPGRNKIKVLYMGRFCFMKNVHSLLDLSLPSGVDLLFAGGSTGSQPDLYTRIMAVHADRSCPKYYLGFLQGEKKQQVLGTVSGIIVPSIHEPFGLVALEAMAMGIPLLCSRTTGLAEVVPEEVCWPCGITCESISKALEDFRDRLFGQDPDVTARVTQAHIQASQFTWELNAYSYLELYRSLVSQTH